MTATSRRRRQPSPTVLAVTVFPQDHPLGMLFPVLAYWSILTSLFRWQANYMKHHVGFSRKGHFRPGGPFALSIRAPHAELKC